MKQKIWITSLIFTSITIRKFTIHVLNVPHYILYYCFDKSLWNVLCKHCTTTPVALWKWYYVKTKVKKMLQLEKVRDKKRKGPCWNKYVHQSLHTTFFAQANVRTYKYNSPTFKEIKKTTTIGTIICSKAKLKLQQQQCAKLNVQLHTRFNMSPARLTNSAF